MSVMIIPAHSHWSLVRLSSGTGVPRGQGHELCRGTTFSEGESFLSAHPPPLPGPILKPTEQNRRFSRHRFFPQLIVQKTLSFPPLICMCTKIGNLDFPRYIFQFFGNFPFFKKKLQFTRREFIFDAIILYSFICFKANSHYIAQVCLELLDSSNPPPQLSHVSQNYLLFKKKR